MITLPLELAREIAAGLRCFKLNKSSLPVLRCLRVAIGAGRFVIHATTLDEWLVHSSPTPCADSADFLIPAEHFLEAAKSADPKSEITFSPAKSGWEIGHHVAGQLMVHPVSGIAVSEFPEIPVFPASGQPLPAGFTRTLEEAMAAASTEDSRQILKSVFLTRSDVIATDGRQLFVSNSLALQLPSGGIIVPSSGAIRVFDAAAPAELLLEASDAPSRVALRQRAWTWASKVIEGNYPNWKQVVPRVETLSTQLVLSPGDAARLQRVMPRLPGASDKDSPVVLTIAPTGIELRASNIGVALMDSVSTGPAVTTSFNRRFLLQALSQGFRTLHVRDNATPVVMREGPRTYLWMPVRMPAEAGVPTASSKSEPVKAPDRPAPTEPVRPMQPEPPREDDPGALESLQRAREILRELQAALTGASNAVRVLERERREVERDLDALKRNLRALKSVEV